MSGLKMGYPLAGSKTPGIALYIGSFVTNGASAPTVVEGNGFTVSAPSTGVYTITIEDGPFPRKPIGCQVSLEDSTSNANDDVRFGDLDSLTTGKTFTIITESSAGTDGNLTGPVVHFLLPIPNTVRGV